MASSAISGYRTLLMAYDGATWMKIAEVQNLSGPSISREALDATHLESAGNAREFVAGMMEAGEFTATVNLNPGHPSQTILLDDIKSATASGAENEYMILWPKTFNAGTFTAAAATDKITCGSDHGMSYSCEPIEVSTTNALPAGLSANTRYWAEKIDADELKLYATHSEAWSATNEIDITDTGTGTHSYHQYAQMEFDGAIIGVTPTAAPGDILQADLTFRIKNTITFRNS